MSSFKVFLNEIAEPAKPSNKVSRSTITKDGGTWKERPVTQFKFQTSTGNEVKIHFEKIEENSYDVMFYVNDTQYDNAGVNAARDPEILANVLWVIRQKCDQLKVKKLSFTAQTGERDIKNIRNLDVSKYKLAFLQQLEKLKFDLGNYQPKLIEPNASLYAKLNRPVPPARPDVDKSLLQVIFNKIEQLLASGESLEDLLNNTYHRFEELQKFGFDVGDFLTSFRNLSNAIESNSPAGWNRRVNRREVVWQRLVTKYFPDWHLSKQGTKFELTR